MILFCLKTTNKTHHRIIEESCLYTNNNCVLFILLLFYLFLYCLIIMYFTPLSHRIKSVIGINTQSRIPIVYYYHSINYYHYDRSSPLPSSSWLLLFRLLIDDGSTGQNPPLTKGTRAPSKGLRKFATSMAGNTSYLIRLVEKWSNLLTRERVE